MNGNQIISHFGNSDAISETSQPTIDEIQREIVQFKQTKSVTNTTMSTRLSMVDEGEVDAAMNDNHNDVLSDISIEEFLRDGGAA